MLITYQMTDHGSHSHTALAAGVTWRIIDFLIRSTNCREALAIAVTGGMACIGVTIYCTSK